MRTIDMIEKTFMTADQGEISALLWDIIHDHEKSNGKGSEIEDGWLRYRQYEEGVPILTKEGAKWTKINERIPDDFYGDIVDTKTGYMGNEVVVELDKEKAESEPNFEADAEAIREWAVKNNSEDLNSTAVKNAAMMGINYRYLYVLKGEKEARIKNDDAWSDILFYEVSIEEPVFGLRYHRIKKKAGKSTKKDEERTIVEWFDRSSITVYEATKNDGDFDIIVPKSPHMFKGVPIIAMPNNDEMFSEPYKVVHLIDAYDAIMSSTVSEIEQLRLAYMYAKGQGLKIDEKFVKLIEQTGIFPLPPEGEIGFANKEINDEVIKTLLEELRKNIYAFGKSIDMSNDQGGDMRVIGWKIALFRLENSSAITERKFKRALRRQYELLADFWTRKQGPKIDINNLVFTFTRNFPRDIASEAETLMKLLTMIPRKRAYALMSFIDDPDKWVEEWNLEKEANAIKLIEEGDDEEDEDEEDLE